MESIKTSYQTRMPRCVVGGECSGALKDIVEKGGCKRVFLVTDKGVRGAGLTERAENILKKAGAQVVVDDGIAPEPSYTEAQQVVDAAKDAELIIGIGGGSVMDSAKLASLLAGAKVSVKDLLDDPQKAKKTVPSLMIPTTCGTGSEATCNAIVAVPEKKVKVGIVNNEMIPDYVLLDAEMIRKLPPRIIAATGVDALAHAVECYTSNKANPFSDAYALYSAKLIFDNIVRAFSDPDDMDAKNAMLIGAFFGGAAITASGTTAVHALSYPLGGAFHIPHGVSNAILFSHVMAFNADCITDRLAALYDVIAAGQTLGTQEEKADYVINKIAEIVAAVGIPGTLESFGVTLADLDFLTESAFGVKRLLNNNRKALSPDDIRAIYLKVL